MWVVENSDVLKVASLGEMIKVTIDEQVDNIS